MLIYQFWHTFEQKNALDIILQNSIELSKQTYGSNAIERCLELGGDGYFLNNFYSLMVRNYKSNALEGKQVLL